jgi:hypothetical protein
MRKILVTIDEFKLHGVDIQDKRDIYNSLGSKIGIYDVVHDAIWNKHQLTHTEIIPSVHCVKVEAEIRWE